MARSPFTVFTRKGSDGKPVYCARFFDDDGTVKKTVTLREAKSATAAARLADKMLRDGIVSNSSNPDALTYLRAFWTRESDYVEGRKLRGVVLSEKYLYESRHVIDRHLEKHLKGKKLLDVTPAMLEKIVLSLSRSGVGPRRVNVALQALRVPFAFYCRQHRLANALPSVEKLAEKPKERGVLTAAEVAKIIALEGESPRVKAAVLLGALCGLRLGEARGLYWTDVSESAKIIHVQHNYVDPTEGVKGPKWGSVRDVPAPEPVRDALRLCAAVAPETKGEYLLWNEKSQESPIDGKTITHGFARVLRAIGIDDAERKRRNLCFHGLRHTFVSLSRAGGVPDFVVQKMAGHSSMSMTTRYSHASVVDFQQARAALEGALAKAAGGEK